MASDDQEKSRKVLLQLDPSLPSANIYPALVAIRTKYIKSPSTLKHLIDQGLTFKLLPLLSKTNLKVVDIAFSIMGNIMLEEVPKRQIRDRSHRGVHLVVSRCKTLISEESVLCRCMRTIANMANDDHKNAVLLHTEGIAGVLVKCLDSSNSAKTKQVVVRAIRILSGTSEHKRQFFDAHALMSIAPLLSTTDEDLLKAVVKCLAHFTHGCDADAASQVRGEDGTGFDRLVGLMNNGKRSVWEAVMACIVNLSHLERLRPTLGNAGAIAALVEKMSTNNDLTSKEVAHSVTALCLYCRESVNRMKLREFGGLKLFITLLNDDRKKSLHNRIINSLLQFAYDDLGLRVLQHYGIVPCLVRFVSRYTERHSIKHDCAEEICRMADNLGDDDDSQAKEEEEKEEEGGNVTSEVMEPPQIEDEDVEPEDDDFPEPAAPIAEEEDTSSSSARGESSAGASAAAADRPSRMFRVNSPSYQAVQHEFEQFERLRNEQSSVASSPNMTGFSWSRDSPRCGPSPCVSPDRYPYSWSSSPGYSPSPSNSSIGSYGSPERVGSPTAADRETFSSVLSAPSLPSYSPSYQEINSPPVSPEDETYSPVERFSDDESSDNGGAGSSASAPLRYASASASYTPAAAAAATSAIPVPSASSRPQPPPETTSLPAARLSTEEAEPSPKKPRATSPLRVSTGKSIFSPTYEGGSSFSMNLLYSSPPSNRRTEQSFFSPLPKPGNAEAPEAGNEAEGRRENSQIGWILQILSRLSQVEWPHEDLMSFETTKALVEYLMHVKKPLSRAERILLRLSKNLNCVMTFVRQRHMSWAKRAIDYARPTLTDSPCPSCHHLIALRSSLTQNISLLAESGYAEGQMCHDLMRGTEKQKVAVAISAPMLVKPRKLLRNILLTHEGMEVLLEILENTSNKDKGGDEQDKSLLFTDAVLSIHTIACHVGVVAPNLKLEEKVIGKCLFKEEAEDEKDLTLTLDDGTTFKANRSLVTSGSGVFEAMLGGSFAESAQSTVRLPMTSLGAVTLLVHYLYGCRWCEAFADVGMETLLELVLTTDKYLLPEFNSSVSQEVVQRFLRGEQVVAIYEKSLRGEYPVSGVEESLARCAVNYLLVGSGISHEQRIYVFGQLVRSQMALDFVDDVNKTVREKLLEVH